MLELFWPEHHVQMSCTELYSSMAFSKNRFLGEMACRYLRLRAEDVSSRFLDALAEVARIHSEDLRARCVKTGRTGGDT
eukprot:2229554-Amphidinium_carterae.1